MNKKLFFCGVVILLNIYSFGGEFPFSPALGFDLPLLTDDEFSALVDEMLENSGPQPMKEQNVVSAPQEQSFALKAIAQAGNAQNLIQQHLIQNIDGDYDAAFKAARAKHQLLAESIDSSHALMPGWVKMLIFSAMAIDDNKNPLFFPQFFDSPLGEMIKEVFRIFKIQIEVVSHVTNPNLKKIDVNCFEMYFDGAAIISKLYVVIKEKVDNVWFAKATQYNNDALFNCGRTIFQKMVRSKEINEAFEIVFKDALEKNINLFSHLNNNEQMFAKTDDNVNLRAFIKIDEESRDLYMEIARLTSERHRVLSEAINNSFVLPDDLKLLLLATLILGNIETNPLLNRASFDKELGRLIQCAMKSFGMDLVLGAGASPQGAHLIFMDSSSLFYAPAKNQFILYSPNLFEPKSTTTLFESADNKTFDYVINSYRNLLLNEFFLNNSSKPKILYENEHLMMGSTRIWNLLLKPKSEQKLLSISSSIVGKKIHQVSSKAFKELFLNEISEPYFSINTLKNLIEEEKLVDPELVNAILTNEQIREQQKLFILWLMTLDFSRLKSSEKDKYFNPLHANASKPNKNGSPSVMVFCSLMDFIWNGDDENQIIKTINNCSPFYRFNQINFNRDEIIYGLDNPAISSSSHHRFSNAYHAMMEEVFLRISKKIKGVEFEKKSVLAIVKKSYVMIGLNLEKISSKDQPKKEQEKTFVNKREMYKKRWLESINVTRYDAVLEETKNFFNPDNIVEEESCDPLEQRVELHKKILNLIDYIEAIDSAYMSRQQKMILYLTMSVKDEIIKKCERKFYCFFAGQYSRNDNYICQTTLGILHLLNLPCDVEEMLCESMFCSYKKELKPVASKRMQRCINRLENAFFGHFEKLDNNVVFKRIGSYFKTPVKDPRKL